jgi:hypothetical protein
VAVLYVGFLLAPTYEDVTLARLYTTEVHFGDPFDIDWIELQGAPDPDTEFSRLLPMVGGDPPCVGFGRPDWPADRRHPSVARCVDAGSIDRLVGPDVVGIREIVAGVETWYFLFLSAAITDLEAKLNDGSMLGSDRIYQGGPYAAILVPTGTPDIALTWRLGVGGAYRCTIDLAADGPPTCT